MPQRLVPVSDVSAGGWSPVPVYLEIDEVSPNDADQVESPEIDTETIDCKAFTVAVTPAAMPPEDGGNHTVSARLRKSGEECLKAAITLLQGGTPIASRNYELSESWQTYSYSLSK